MEEGLNTSCSIMCSIGLDLNKDPFDQIGPTLTDKVSRQDLDLNESINEVVREHDAGEVRDEHPRKQVEIVDMELQNEGLSLMSSGLSPVVENGHNVAGRGNVELCCKADAGKIRGTRGRKKKEVRDSRTDDVERVLISNALISLKEKPVGVESGKITKNPEDSIDDSTQVQFDGGIANKPANSGRGRGRKTVKAEASKCHDDYVSADEQVYARSDQRGRGRKRKNGAGVECLNDDQVKRGKANTMLSLGQSKRVLRSGIVAVIDGKKHVYGVNDDDFSCEKTENKNDLCDKKIPKSKNDDNTRPIEEERKKLKGRRGRPPKIEGRNEIAVLTSSQKDKLRGPKRSMNFEKADTGSKHLKVNQTNHEKDTDLANTEGNNEGPRDGGNKRLSCDPYHPKKTKMKGSKSEVKEGRREQQQAVREQIIDILMKVGWTIEYRPRQTKEYSDAVYVDPEGKTHWSVTKAYHKLKEKVEAGAVDEKTSAAFTPIPEEVLSTLFRVRKEENKGKKRQKDVGSKTNKKMIKKKLSKKQSAKSSLGGSDHRGGGISPKTGHNSSVAIRRKKLGEEGGQRRKPCTLLARNSKVGADSDDDDFILYDGKRTLLAWMIDLGIVQSNAQVHYIYGGRKKQKLEGKITGDGICCGCCGETLNLTDFESHAGSKLGRPFENVILESGRSLFQCLVDSWNKQKEIDRIGFHFVDVVGDDPNDDTCNICGDGGDLICCDGCPSTFHQSCLDIQKFPSGDWRCVYCSCKFCGTVVRRSSENDAQDGMIVSKLSTCHLCEGKFHLPCISGDGALDFDSKDLSFCGNGCQKIFQGLQVLLGVRHDMDEGFCWRLLRHHNFGRDVNLTDDMLDVESNCKLAVVLSIMDECFVPIVDERSNINVIQSVVYSCGSNFRRLNYNGFYSVILEKDDELVSAASIRIHGNQLAEMPFIGTRYMYRRQGMCRRLLTGIETALCSLGVEKLVIPAIPELIETWTKVFGFTPLEKSKRQEMKYMSMIVFPGTDMLQKPLLKDQFSEGQVTSTGSNADAIYEVKLNQDDKVAGLPVESSLDVADGVLNDMSNCRNTRHASEPDTYQIERIAKCTSAEPGSGTIPSDAIDEQHCTKTYQHCVMENKSINSPIESISTSHEEKVIHSVEESKDAANCLPEREVECRNYDSDSLGKDCQETSVYRHQNACHTLEVPSGKDSIASSEMTSDSTDSVKATPKALHQIEKVVCCSDLPVSNGYACDKTSTSDLTSLNFPLASQETSDDIMRSNINDHKEVSVGLPVLSMDSKSLQDEAQLSAKPTEGLESHSS